MFQDFVDNPNLICRIISPDKIQTVFEFWLDTVYCEIEPENMFDDPVKVTNRTIMNTGEIPEGWFNPFTLTHEELDKMRIKFKGGYKKWQEWVREFIPFLDIKSEGKLKKIVNRDKDISMCGVATRGGINPITGKFQCVTWYCKRRGCPKCETRKKSLVRDRLEKVIGKQYLELDNEAQVQQTLNENEGVSYIRIPSDNGKILLVIDTDKHIGQTFTYELAKQYSELPPSGKNISGKLGLDVPVVPEDNYSLDFDNREVQVSTGEFLLDTNETTIKELKREYEKETKDLDAPKSIDDCQKMVYQREKILQDIAVRLEINIFFLYRTIITITEKEFKQAYEPKVIKQAGTCYMFD